VQMTDVIKDDTKIGSRISRGEYDIVRQIMVGLLSLGSCCGKPKMRNSVLERLRDRMLEDIQLDTLALMI